MAKFTQNEDLKEQLKCTQDAILAECAVKDPDRLDINRWKGSNLLGYALMMVRRHL